MSDQTTSSISRMVTSSVHVAEINENNNNQLVCGTSLAESEYHNDRGDDDDDDEKLPSSSLSWYNSNHNFKYKDRTQHQQQNSKTVYNDQENLEIMKTDDSAFVDFEMDASNNHTIESLRNYISSIVWNDSDSNSSNCMMFASPFEVPAHNTNNNKQQQFSNSSNYSSNRYYQVPLIYCDQTASNRAVQSIEQYIERTCLPMYGNTHTNTSRTGSQSTAFVAEARQIVAEQTNAKITGKASLDIVLFTGSGVTSAVELLIDCLGLKNSIQSSLSNRPVVFIGPYEHHSNLIPWRETGCEIVMIPECMVDVQSGYTDVDMQYLETMLQKIEYSNRMKIGTFTAASNVTGKVCNVHQIAQLLHQYNALCFIDYATAAPYLKINMNPVTSSTNNHNNNNNNNDNNVDYTNRAGYLDAVFISPHKMLGGIGTPGILIVKKHLVSQMNAPNRSGGGTVFYVTNNHHRFLSNRIERYEGGTPNVLGIIRTGLTFLFKRQIEEQYKYLSVQKQQQEQETDSVKIPSSVQEYDFATYKKVAEYLDEHAPNLVLLGRYKGCDKDNRWYHNNLPIFSFLIKFGKRYLHYNYVCAILNDVFGIQSRGGCQCAGPYSQRLLGLTKWDNNAFTEVSNEQNKEIEYALLKYKERSELLRPGYTRLSLPFKGLSSEVVEYVMKALAWVSKHGWALMCQYRCNHRTGEWRHSSRQGKPFGRDERRWLSHYNFIKSNELVDLVSTSTEKEMNISSILNRTLSNANAILDHAKSDHRSIVEASKMVDADLVLGVDDDAKLEELRWYVYPKECAALLLDGLSDCSDKENHMGALNPNSETSIKKLDPQDEGACSSPRLIVDNFRIDNDRKRKVRGGEELIQELNIQEHEHLDEYKVDNKSDVPKLQTIGKKANRDSTQWGQATCVIGEPTKRKVICSEADIENTASNEPLEKSVKKKKFRHQKPPAKIMRLATQAIMQWDMIESGDKLLLGLSGGKDSLSLLHCLLEFQRVLPMKFELEVCTIDPMTPSFDPSPLIPYVESLGLKYHYIKDNIVERANRSGKDGKIVSSLCAFCARMKRGNLYSCARQNHCNKLVLAQHLDDCAESFMMSVMHNGSLRTMKANYPIDAGDLFVIRPLIYCRESLMTDFAKSTGLPVINENCPACFEEPKERARIKKMLSREETMHPNFYDSIKRSLIPLMHDDLSPILRSYTEEVVSKSRTNHLKKGGKTERNHEKVSSNTDNITECTREKVTCNKSLSDISDEDLIMELARRKAKKFKQVSASNDDLTGILDPTGQVCTLKGGNGSIPCRELME